MMFNNNKGFCSTINDDLVVCNSTIRLVLVINI